MFYPTPIILSVGYLTKYHLHTLREFLNWLETKLGQFPKDTTFQSRIFQQKTSGKNTVFIYFDVVSVVSHQSGVGSIQKSEQTKGEVKMSSNLPSSARMSDTSHKVVSVSKEMLPTSSISSFTTPNLSLGIRFDIDKIKSQTSGLYGYGVESWKVFWQAIDSQKLKGIMLSEGDTRATLSGRENVYCIAVQANSDTLNEIKTSLENSAEFQQVAAPTRFVEGGGLAGEPLMDAGQVDLTGNFVGEESIPPHTAFGIVQRKKQNSSTAVQPSPTKAKSVEQPKEIDIEVVQELKKKWWQFWKS